MVMIINTKAKCGNNRQYKKLQTKKYSHAIIVITKTLYQLIEEGDGGDHPLQLQLEAAVRVVLVVIVHKTPLRTVALELGVRVQLHATVDPGVLYCRSKIRARLKEKLRAKLRQLGEFLAN